MRQEGAILKNTSTDDLTERIRVIYFETKRNERGDIIKGEEKTRCEVWAKVLPLTGKISDTTPARENVITYRITIRHRADLKPDDEIIWRGTKLKILTPPIDVETRHIFIQFDCEEVVKDGKAYS